MAIDAIIAVLADTAAADVGAAVLGDAVAGAVADTVVADAVGSVVADGIAAGLTDTAIAGAADAAAGAATDALASGVAADAAGAAGIDAAAAETAGAIAPATEAGASAVDLGTAADLGAETAGAVAPESGVATVEVSPGGDIVNGVQTGANPTGVPEGSVAPSGGTGQTITFDDGSTLTMNADGTVSSTAATDTGAIYDANGNRLVSPGGPGQAPVYEAGPGTPGLNNPYGAGDIPLGTALGDYAGAVAGNLGTTGLLGAGALGAAALGGALTPTSNLTGQVGSGNVNYEWGQGTPLVDTGLNPGYIGQVASMPYYQSTNPTDAQYYWGVHAPINTPADLANYNQQAGAPTTPWGAGHGGGGAPGTTFNPADFVNQYITNPAWAGVMNATTPGYIPPAAGPVVPAGGPNATILPVTGGGVVRV